MIETLFLALSWSSFQPVTTLTPGQGDEPWCAEYEAQWPIERLTFKRPADHFRRRVWQVQTAGYAFAVDDDLEVLTLEDGAPAQREVRLCFPIFTDHLPKEYEFFQVFSDGAVLFYPGHLYASAASGNGETIDYHRVAMAPRHGEHLIVAGTVHRSAMLFSDPDETGTFVYFGDATPLITDVMTTIIDPGLPGWLHDQFVTLVPQLFDWLTTQTGQSLRERPLVFFSFDDADTPGLSYGGGVLPNAIQLSVSGNEWVDQSPDGVEHLFKFLAHEATHLWNGNLFSYDGEEHAWMHEGGADAFALRAMSHFGLISRQRRLDLESQALNQCVNGLTPERALVDSAGQGHFQNYYSCGNVIALWTETAIREVNPDADLLRFWRKLFDSLEHEYSEQDYFAALRGAGVDDDLVGRLQDLITNPASSPVNAWVSLLNAVDVPVESEADDPPEHYRESHGRRALQALMAIDCDGAYSFSRQGASLQTFNIEGCRTFAGQTVAQVAGHAVIDEGHLAYDALVAACAAGGSVEVTPASADALTIPCAQDYPQRVPSLAIVRVPGNR